LIHIIQCLCPQRHAISAVFYNDENLGSTEALDWFHGVIELAIEQGLLYRRCEICRADTEFHYEDGITSFKTLAEAEAVGRVYEQAQLRLRRQFDVGRN
jgi:hypothetical protein